MSRILSRVLVVAGLATLIGGTVKEDQITVLEAKVIRLPVPTQGYQPFTPNDVIFVAPAKKTTQSR